MGLYEIGRGKTVGAQLHWIPQKLSGLSLVYNLLNGTEISGDGVTHVRTLHEFIPAYQLSPSLALNADFLFGILTRAKAISGRDAEWFAWSLGAKWQFRENLYLSPRVEMYFDRSGATIETSTSTKPALPQKISGATLTLGWQVEPGLELRVEARQDHSSGGHFPKTDGTLRTSQSSATVGLLFDF